MPSTGYKGQIRKSAIKKKSHSLLSFGVDLPQPTVGGPSKDYGSGDAQVYLQIKPALTDKQGKVPKKSDKNESNAITLEAIGEGKVQLCRSSYEKERFPDRICLDRRGLSTIPYIVHEPELRLISLQHNLISSLGGVNNQNFSKLVFLDLYNNQLEKIFSIDKLVSLRVLLLGKNRIRKIEGLSELIRLEVLDLHGNRICRVSGLSSLRELKVLNLAGNSLKIIGQDDLEGLVNLKELNVKKNKLKKLLGFEHTPRMEKLFLSSNDLQSVESMTSLAAAQSLTEITLDSNPVALGGDCIPFLVAYLPNLLTISSMPVTEQVRQAALTWRSNKEKTDATLAALGQVEHTSHRDQVIQNARANWELLRTDFKSLASKITNEKQPEQSLPEGEAKQQTLEESLVKNYDKWTPIDRKYRSVTAKRTRDKRVNFCERSASLETEASHSTSTSSDMIKLPPILLPIISSLENTKITEQNDVLLLKRWDSISSVEPAVDSSMSSITSESEDEDERRRKNMTSGVKKRTQFTLARSKTIAEIQGRAKGGFKDDSSSNLSTNANSVQSNSSTDVKPLRRHNSLSGKSNKRGAKSATNAARKNNTSPLTRAVTAKVKTGKTAKREENVPKPASKERNIASSVESDGTSLCLCGAEAIRRLDLHPVGEEAITAHFRYVPYAALSNALPKLKAKFPNITHLTFRATGLQYLGQLNALAELRGLKALTIGDEGNPIDGKKWREYAIYRLAHWGLREINGTEVTEAEIHSSNATYDGLSDMVIRALPEEPLAPLVARLGRSDATNACGWIRKADPALKSVVAKEALQWRKGHLSQEDMNWRARGLDHLNAVIDTAVDTTRSLRILEEEWHDIFVETIEAALRDFRDMDNHVKESMKKIVESECNN